MQGPIVRILIVRGSIVRGPIAWETMVREPIFGRLNVRGLIVRGPDDVVPKVRLNLQQILILLHGEFWFYRPSIGLLLAFYWPSTKLSFESLTSALLTRASKQILSELYEVV